MKVTNNSASVIYAGKFILPNQSAVIDETWSKNPVIKVLIQRKILLTEKGEGTSSEINLEAMIIEAATLSAESSKRTLNAFAKKYSINIEGAETAEDIYAVIYAYVQVASKNA